MSLQSLFSSYFYVLFTFRYFYQFCIHHPSKTYHHRIICDSVVGSEAPVPDASAKFPSDLKNKMSSQWPQNILYPGTAYTLALTRWPLSGRITCDDPPPHTHPHPQLPNIYCNTIFSDLSASLVISGLRMFQALLQELNAEPCHSSAAAVGIACFRAVHPFLICFNTLTKFQLYIVSRKDKKKKKRNGSKSASFVSYGVHASDRASLRFRASRTHGAAKN